MMLRTGWALIAAAAVFVAPALAVAGDEILDHLKEAEGAYKEGNFSGAIDALEFAKTKLLEKQSNKFDAALPGAMLDYKVVPGRGNDAAAMAFLGGGTGTNRRYEKKNKSIEIIVSTNPTLVTSYNMATKFAAHQPNTTLTKIKGNKALQMYDPARKRAEITMVLLNTMAIRIEGDGQDNIDDAVKFSEAIDYKPLKEAAMGE